jgi:maltose alpha-D-glucosyltransferase/alpha-amylase
VIDQEYGGDRILLAEANQWPEDVRPYFGNGDEFHMSFHFPLMPRLYLGLRLEDTRPITDIFTHTPPIPPACQWGLFLRNHDELTLEMVTNEERAFMYYAYAHDADMKLNLGIRRRLAPLLDGDRRRVELLNCLLLTLPGSPIIYYGDEIGMGDNVYLGDRNGVRTPMQWSRDRNAGFSAVEHGQLYLPVITDPVYGYEAVNVAAQARQPSSLLNTMRRLLAARRTSSVFGRGSIEFLRPRNSKVLAYLRRHGRETLLIVANLSAAPQPVELDLAAFAGATPIEMLGTTRFPAIRTAPYFLSLGPHGFYWFRLERPGDGDEPFGIERTAI